MKLYGVMAMNQKMGVKLNNSIPEIKCDIDISWADGMVGAIPLFKTLKDAEKYANGKQVFEADLDD